MFKLDLEKAEEREIKLPTSTGSSKKQESSRKTSFCFTDYVKAFDCVDKDHEEVGVCMSREDGSRTQVSEVIGAHT